MAVVGLAQERPDSPQASFALGRQTITRKFLVVTSSKNDGPIEVSLAIGLPRLFQVYAFGNEFHPYCRCRSIDPQRVRPGSLEWEVTCSYSTPEPKGSASGEGGSSGGGDKDGDGSGDAGGGTGEEKDGEFENPLLALPEVETRFETSKQVINGCQGLGYSCDLGGGDEVDVAGGAAFFSVGDSVAVGDGKITLNTTIAAIVGSTLQLAKAWPGAAGRGYVVDLSFHPLRASNGEVFVPPPDMDVSSLILTITRNEDLLTPHPALAILYQDKLNSDSFWGASPGQAKCMSITTQRQVKQLPNGVNFPYLRSTYTFKFRGSWDIQLLDYGTYTSTIVTVDGEASRQDVTQVTKNMYPQTVLLDGNGGKLADGGTPVSLVVRPYGSLPFSALNLPNSFQEVQ